MDLRSAIGAAHPLSEPMVAKTSGSMMGRGVFICPMRIRMKSVPMVTKSVTMAVQTMNARTGVVTYASIAARDAFPSEVSIRAQRARCTNWSCETLWIP
jgi:hypothetical protein